MPDYCIVYDGYCLLHGAYMIGHCLVYDELLLGCMMGYCMLHDGLFSGVHDGQLQ